MRQIFTHMLLVVTIIIITVTYILDLSSIKPRFSIVQDSHQHPTYDVSTSVCKIPHMDPYDKSVKHLISHTKMFCRSKQKLVISNDTHLIMNKEAFSQYYLKSSCTCYYQAFWRVPPTGKQKDKQVKWNNTKVYFNESVRVTDEFVQVRCTNKRKEIYLDYFAFVPVKEVPNEDLSLKSNTKLNILMLGLDSVSRMNFYRQMPKTRKYVEDHLKGIEFYGSNKVGDNTYPNLMAAFAGKNEFEIKDTCHLKQWDRFDNCSFIWDQAHVNGYATGFAEEMTKLFGLFTYNKGGFHKVPIMHYWETFSNLLEADMDANRLYIKKCNGYRPSLPYLLEYTSRFIRTYHKRKNYFLYSWEATYTHSDLNYDPKVDSSYETLLQILNKNGYLNNTVLFFMSDHGLRFGPILNVSQGRMEERLPFFYVILPEWFRQNYPEVLENLKINTHRLTTHFDLYETFKAILQEDYSTTPQEQRGISLFRQVPENRTCESAGISPHWCTCQPLIPISNTNTTVAAVTAFIIDHLNDLLTNYSECERLVLDKIVDAGVLEETFIKTKVHEVHYSVVFQTEPGGGLFDATVKCSNCVKDFEMAGPVSRHNLYGHQSDCVHDSLLKLYCMCKARGPLINKLVNLLP